MKCDRITSLYGIHENSILKMNTSLYHIKILNSLHALKKSSKHLARFMVSPPEFKFPTTMPSLRFNCSSADAHQLAIETFGRGIRNGITPLPPVRSEGPPLVGQELQTVHHAPRSAWDLDNSFLRIQFDLINSGIFRAMYTFLAIAVCHSHCWNKNIIHEI